MSPHSDRELIAAAAQGQVAAFATLVGRYRDMRTRFAIRMLGSYRAADEALQAAFVRAFQSIVRYKEPEPFADWLFRIVINECRARALRSAVRARRVLTGEFDVVPETAAKPETEPEDEGQRALNQIDPINREPFILQYIEELTYQEIATLTGASVVTLERQVDRACVRLRELLPQWETQQEPTGGLIRFDDVGPSFPVRVALPLRRAEVLDDSFEDRLMSKLLRPGEAADALVASESDSGEQSAVSGARSPTPTQPIESAMNQIPMPPTPPTSPWTQGPKRPSFRIPDLAKWAPAGLAIAVALAGFGTGYAARAHKDARQLAVAKARPKTSVAPRIVRHTDTVRVTRSDTLVIARFVYADQSAHAVTVIGDFNHWDPTATPLTRAGTGTWAATLKLKPARYEYAFLVDGKHWVTDRATRATRDQFDAQSSVLSIAGATVPGSETTAGARLKKVLPHATAEHVLATISTARSQGLPAGALENHALRYVAEHVAPKEIDRVISAESAHMARASALFAAADRRDPSADEITAGAELLARDADSTGIPAMARAASGSRSLAVPLRVSTQLIASAVPARDALKRVEERLRAGASDAQLERLADDAAARLAAKTKTKETHVAKRSSSSAAVRQAGAPVKPKPTKKKKSA
jgi:RNA polymerase sigma-70 factor (ECF subfamily)